MKISKKSLSVILAFVVLLSSFSIMGITAYADECAHEHAYWEDAVSPTCNKAGYTGNLFCNDCMEYLEYGETIPATGEHDFENGICKNCYTVDWDYNFPTLTLGNRETFTVSVGEFKCFKFTPEESKYYSMLFKTVSTEVSLISRIVSSEINYPDGPESWESHPCNSVQPVLFKGGVTYLIVINGYNWDEESSVSAFGVMVDPDNCTHEGETKIANSYAPTCYRVGYSGDIICAFCGETLEKGQTLPKTDDHSFSYGTCMNCGRIDFDYSFTPLTLGQNDFELEDRIAHYSFTPEETANYYFSVNATSSLNCYLYESADDIIYEPNTDNDHSPFGFSLKLEAGQKYVFVPYICDYPEDFLSSVSVTIINQDTCAHSQTEIINASDPTCVLDGSTGETVCKICGKTVIQAQVIPATGHKPGEMTEIEKATYTHEGKRECKCTVCGEVVETEVIPKLIRNGWFTVNGKRYYYKNDVMLKGWQSIKNSKGVAYKYYFNPSNGVMLTGWQSIKNSKGVAYKYYFNPSNGVMLTGWQSIKNSKGVAYKYYFNPSNGVMLTGWQSIKNSKGVAYKYYFNPSNGVMLTGWQSIKNSKGVAYKYYFNPSNGVMLTGWQSIKNSKGVAYKYYFNPSNGVMFTGWQTIKNSKGVANKYYFGDNGYMRTGFQTIKNSKGVAYKYYFGTDGVMVTGWQTIKNSKGVEYRYCFNPNGTMRTGWQKMRNSKGDTAYFYFGDNGYMRTGWQTIKNSKGVANKYYFGSDGLMRTGWQKMHNEKGKTAYFYFGSDGVMVANKSLKIGKKTYKFDKNGICLNP